MTTTNYDPRVLKAPHPVPGAPDNWKRFFSFNTDAKVIGIQYIATSLFFLLVGGLLAMIVRGELITPPADLVDPSVYNGLYTMHGTVMLFLFLFPMYQGLRVPFRPRTTILRSRIGTTFGATFLLVHTRSTNKLSIGCFHRNTSSTCGQGPTVG